MMRGIIGTIVMALACAGCSSKGGELVTHSQFAYPNSDIGLFEVDNTPLDVSETVFIWEDPPLLQMHDTLMERAKERVKGKDLPRSMKVLKRRVEGHHLEPVLINQKWVVTTTMFPLLPMAIYTLRLEGTAAEMDVFNKAVE